MTKVAKATYVAAKLWGDCTKEDKEGSSGSSPNNKRKRFVFTQDAMLSSLMWVYMTDSVKDVAFAIRETKMEIMHHEFYDVVSGFPK